jgi:epoxyqueuosine reductase
MTRAVSARDRTNRQGPGPSGPLAADEQERSSPASLPLSSPLGDENSRRGRLNAQALDVLRDLGLAGGLHALGATSADPFPATRAELERRRDEGLHGGMQFTYRNPTRSTDPTATLPSARTLLVGARSYRRETPPELEQGGPVGRVARYVWADDYGHLRRGLGAVAERLRDDGWKAVVVADENNLVDRAAAHRAGLGWFGKNSNLLLPGHGSWFVLGSVITDAPLEPSVDAQPQLVPDGCGSCTRCLDSCPTGAIVAPGVVDARRCLAWSLQVTGPFPREQRVALADRIYGCDDCQEVCPPNRRELRVGQPNPPVEPAAAWVAILEMLDMADDALLARFGHWYVPRRQPRYLRRNALVVLGNTADPAGHPLVRACLVRYLADADPMLRAHAAWAVRRLGWTDLLDAAASDDAPEVREELLASAPPRRTA